MIAIARYTCHIMELEDGGVSESEKTARQRGRCECDWTIRTWWRARSECRAKPMTGDAIKKEKQWTSSTAEIKNAVCHGWREA